MDLAITIAACMVFDIETGLFSFVGLMAKTLVIDGTIENVNLCKYFTIITDSPDDIVLLYTMSWERARPHSRLRVHSHISRSMSFSPY